MVVQWRSGTIENSVPSSCRWARARPSGDFSYCREPVKTLLLQNVSVNEFCHLDRPYPLRILAAELSRGTLQLMAERIGVMGNLREPQRLRKVFLIIIA